MTSRAAIAVVSPGQTSSGGSAFTAQLVPELESVIGEPVPTAGVPATGKADLPDTVADARTVVFLGARAFRTRGSKVVFWPLNVAPLDHSIALLPHSSPKNRARHVLLRRRLAQSVGRADALCFGSHYARTLYTAQYAKAAPLPYQVIPGGTPSLPISGLAREPDSAQPTILACSHLYPYKGIIELVEAFALLYRDFPALKLRIAGADRDRRYAAAVRARVSALGLDDAIHIAPAAPDELSALYRTAVLAVFPSLCENAGSFALFDGLHAGVPTVCSDRSSMPEMSRGATLLVNPHDRVAMATEMSNVLTNQATQSELSRRATAWSRSAPTWRDRATLLWQFVEGLNR